MTSAHLQDGKGLLAAALLVGLLIRGIALSQTAGLGTPIIDEQHYAQLAGSLLKGDGFAWGPGRLTSFRPPLYSTLIAGIWFLAGGPSLQAVRLVQVGLSLVTVWIVFLLGRHLFTPKVGRLAAAGVWLYPSLIYFNVTILTETLYTFLLVLFVYLAVRIVETPSPRLAVASGVVLGLTCLTRSSLWPLPLILCPLLVVIVRAPLMQRVAMAVLLFIGFAAAIAPWAVRNTRLQGVVTFVDTMGGPNLRMGNYEYTPEDRMWAAVELDGDRSWNRGVRADFPSRPPTEGEKDKWAQRKAIEYIRANPGVTFRRSLLRFADFWGLEREYAAGLAQGLYKPPSWLGFAVSAVIAAAFIVVATLGAAGVWLAGTRDWRLDAVVLLPGLAIMAAHTLVFGHSRYHVPLVPMLAVYAASLWCTWPRPAWAWRPGVAGAAASVAVLVAIWLRQILTVDAARIQSLFAHVR